MELAGGGSIRMKRGGRWETRDTEEAEVIGHGRQRCGGEAEIKDASEMLTPMTHDW